MASRYQIPQLPPELYSRIADELDTTDTRTLLNLCLTSSSIGFAAERVLYRSFGSNLNDAHHSSLQTHTRFLQSACTCKHRFMVEEYSNIGLRQRYFNYSTRQDRFNGLQPSEVAYVYLDNLQNAISQLLNLKRLYLADLTLFHIELSGMGGPSSILYPCQWRSPTSSHTNHLNTLQYSLQDTCELPSDKERDIPGFLAFLESQTRLCHLSLKISPYDRRVPEEETITVIQALENALETSIPSLPTVKFLHTRSIDIPIFLPFTPNLQALSLYSCEPSAFSPPTSLCTSILKNIQYLHVVWEQEDPFIFPLMKYLMSLKDLVINFLHRRDSSSPSTVASWLEKSDLYTDSGGESPGSIEHIRIVVECTEFTGTTRLQRVARVLFSKNQSLKQLEIQSPLDLESPHRYDFICISRGDLSRGMGVHPCDMGVEPSFPNCVKLWEQTMLMTQS